MARNYVKLPYPQNLKRALLDVGSDLYFTEDEVRDAVDLAYEKKRLTPRQHEIINLRFKEKMSSKEVAAKYELVPQRINQIENKALRKLRQFIVVQKQKEKKNKKVFLNIYAWAKLSEREYQELRALAYDKERSEETGIDAFNNLDGFKWPEWFINRVLNNLEIIKNSYIPDDCWSDLDKEVFEDE